MFHMQISNVNEILSEQSICFVLLGGTLALFVHYRNLVHAPNSKDVVEAVFKSDGVCYRLTPHIVPC